MPSGDGIRQVLAYSLEPEITEKRVTGDKLLVRGLARVHLLCVTVEGSLLGKDLEAAFSQLAELDRPYEADARSDVLMAVTGLEVDMSEENLALKASLTAQYVISERTVLELVEDAFSPRREVGLRQEELYLPAVLDEWAQRLTPQVDFGDQIAEPLDVRFWPGYPQIIRGIDRAEVEVPGRFQLLGRDAEGVLRCISGSWTGSVDLGADDTSQMDGVVQPCADIQLLHSVGALEARCEIGLQVTALARRGLPMITALELGPEREADPQRPSLILCRAGARGLWDIARTTGSSVSAIMAANGLTEEPSDRRMLLIPVS